MLAAVGKADEALLLLSAADASAPMDRHVVALRARLLRQAGRTEDALAVSSLLVQIDPTSSEGYAGAAWALASMNGPKQPPWDRSSPAIKAAETAISLNPDDDFAWLQLVRANVARKNERHSHRALKRMQQRHPRSPLTAVAAAVDGLEWRLRFSPWFLPFLLIPGAGILVVTAAIRATSSGRRLRRADTLLASALAREPDSPELLRLRGLVQHQLGRTRVGLGSSVAAAHLDPDPASITSLVRRASGALGRYTAIACIVWFLFVVVVFSFAVQPQSVSPPTAIAVGAGGSVAIWATTAWIGWRVAASLPRTMRPRLWWPAAGCLLVGAAAAVLVGIDPRTSGVNEPAELHQFLAVTGWTTALALLAAAGFATFSAVRSTRAGRASGPARRTDGTRP